MIKKLILAVLIIVDAILLYMSCGYIYRGLHAVKLVGETTAHFIGYYMLAAPFILGFVLSLTATFIFTFKCIINHSRITTQSDEISIEA